MLRALIGAVRCLSTRETGMTTRRRTFSTKARRVFAVKKTGIWVSVEWLAAAVEVTVDMIGQITMLASCDACYLHSCACVCAARLECATMRLQRQRPEARLPLAFLFAMHLPTLAQVVFTCAPGPGASCMRGPLHP